MIGDILRGVSCIARGCNAFYGDRGAWKYAAMPFGILSIAYLLAFWGIMHFSGWLADACNRLTDGMPSWLEWLHSVVSGSSYLLGIVVACLLLGTTFCLLYELFGGFFFDALVEYYVRRQYGKTPVEQSLGGNMRNIVDAIVFACKVLFYNVLLLAVAFIFPVAGQVLLVLVLGYYLAVSYMICPACNDGLRIPELQRIAVRRRTMVTAFGVVAYLLLLIPFATIFLLPGIVLGGVELWRQGTPESESGR